MHLYGVFYLLPFIKKRFQNKKAHLAFLTLPANHITLLKKQQKILFNYAAGPVLFLILAFLLYGKVKNQPDLPQKIDLLKNIFSKENTGLLICLFGLMMTNWGIEAYKWKLLMKPVQQVSYFIAVKAVLSGLSLSLFLPNGIGEYAGRTVYMEEGNRLRSVSLNVVGSMAQLIITLVVGLFSLLYLRHNTWQSLPQVQGLSGLWLNGIFSMIALGTLILIITYFRLSWLALLLEKIPFVNKYKLIIEGLENFEWKYLTKILILSITRFCVFAVQYIVVLKLMHVQIDFINAFCTTSVLFIVLAILPTIPLADIGIRSQVATQLFGLLTGDIFGIVATTACIWFVNLIIPSMAGTLFISGIRIFKKLK